MKSEKLVTGIVLVGIGAIFLLNNLGYIDFHWTNIIRLWPIILVMMGVNLILSNNNSGWATALKVLVVLGGFSIILFADMDKRIWPFGNFQTDDYNRIDKRKEVVKIQGNSIFNQPYSNTASIAELNISGAGTTYSLTDTTPQLFNATTQEYGGKYAFTHTQTDSVVKLDFTMEDKKVKFGNKKFNWDSDKNNTATIKLNAQPIWDINVQTAASKVNFDLTKFKIRNLDISGGAASYSVKLGQPLNKTDVSVSTGASEINIQVPKDAACHIVTESALSSTNFNGFTKVDDHYETPGFATAKNKIFIKIKGGISDFNVTKY